jgi:hypothetical protein
VVYLSSWFFLLQSTIAHDRIVDLDDLVVLLIVMVFSLLQLTIAHRCPLDLDGFVVLLPL